MKLKRIMLGACVLLSVNASSQNDQKLDTAVVTTPQIPQTIQESGRNITVITAKEIQALPATSLDEILQVATGVEIQSRGGFGAQGDILMRGATYTQVLVLIDGMKMNDPLTGHFNSYIPVTPAEIERIEILRGAAATTYGADAVGGVINIITRTFSNNTYPDGMLTSGSFNHGQHKLINARQGFNYTNGKTSFGAGFQMNKSDGESFPEKVIDTATTLTAYNNHFDIRTLGASFAHRFSDDLSIHFRSAYDFRQFGARYFYTTSPFDKSEETVANWWNQMRIAKKWQNGLTDINFSYKYNTDEFIFSPDFPSTNNHVSRFANMMANHLYEVNDDFKLKFGVQADQRLIESNDRGNHDDTHFGAYAMAHLRFGDLNITASARGDHDDNYGFEFTPQINTAWIQDRFVVRASAGRVIRAADYTERYVSNNLVNLTPGRSLGNPNLVAESGWSEELGVDFTVNQNWLIKSTFFARQSDNLIDYVTTNQLEIGSVSTTGSLRDSADYFFAKNISDVATTGFELESQLRTSFGEKGSLRWTLGYTYLNTTNADDVISVYISSHAKHLITSSLLMKYEKFDLSLSGLYKERLQLIASGIGTELTPTYFVAHGRIGYQITSDFGLNLQVQNILDTKYQNILGANMPGRWMMFGVRWSI